MPKTILFVTDDPGRGGCYRIARTSWRGIEGPYNCIFASGGAQDLQHNDNSEKHWSVAFPADERRRDWSAHAANEAADLLIKTRPDLIVTHDASALTSLIALKRLAVGLKIPFISFQQLVRHDFTGSPANDSFIAREWPKLASRLVFVSEENRARFLKTCPLPADRSVVIENGVGASKGIDRANARNLLLEISSANPAALLLLLPARLDPTKGQALGLKIVRSISEKTSRAVHLAFAGDGPVETQAFLKAKAAAEGVKANVSFLGHRDDVRTLMKGADIVLQLAESEGMPLSMLEAMAESAAIVAAPAGGVSDALAENAGRLVPRGDHDPQAYADLFAREILDLSSDTVASGTLRENAHARWQRNFSESRMIERHQQLIEDVLAEHSAKSPRRSIKLSRPRRMDHLDFSDPRTAWNVAGEGWTHQDDGAIWSKGNTATLTVIVPETNPPAQTVLVEVSPPGWRIGRQVELRVNGEHALRRRFLWRGPGLWSLPVNLPAGSKMVLSFHILSRGLERPVIACPVADRVGIGLRSLTFLNAAEKPASQSDQRNTESNTTHV